MKKGNIIFSASLDHGDFIRAEVSCETKIQAKMCNAAYTLRKIIMEAKRTPLSENLNIEDIAKGEIMIPDPLLQFFTHLICGSDKRRGVKESKKCRVEAICLDIIFATSSGIKKPAKNIILGMVMKSIRGSRRVINILNRLGHSISYSTVEELETELTFGESNREQIPPTGWNLKPSLSTSVAFDNIDRFVEPLSRKDTLQDTVGIAYQL